MVHRSLGESSWSFDNRWKLATSVHPANSVMQIRRWHLTNDEGAEDPAMAEHGSSPRAVPSRYCSGPKAEQVERIAVG